MIDTIWGVRLIHGALMLWGENVKVCKEYLQDALVEYRLNSVEDICIYCKNHGISVSYINDGNIDLHEYYLVRKIARKYSVYEPRTKLASYRKRQEKKIASAIE